jgi:uncharacterized membrane protein
MEDNELDHLLSRGRGSGPQREAILERVLSRTSRRTRGWRGAALAFVAIGSLGAIALIATRPEVADHAFRAKGAGASVTLDLDCIGGAPSACPAGSTLLFGVVADDQDGYLGAYATGASGQIWYFSADVESPRMPAAGATRRAFSRGIRIGPEHQPGHYDVAVLLTTHPLSRQQLLAPPAGVVLARRTFGIEVVPQ